MGSIPFLQCLRQTLGLPISGDLGCSSVRQEACLPIGCSAFLAGFRCSVGSLSGAWGPSMGSAPLYTAGGCWRPRERCCCLDRSIFETLEGSGQGMQGKCEGEVQLSPRGIRERRAAAGRKWKRQSHESPVMNGCIQWLSKLQVHLMPCLTSLLLSLHYVLHQLKIFCIGIPL